MSHYQQLKALLLRAGVTKQHRLWLFISYQEQECPEIFGISMVQENCFVSKFNCVLIWQLSFKWSGWTKFLLPVLLSEQSSLWTKQQTQNCLHKDASLLSLQLQEHFYPKRLKFSSKKTDLEESKQSLRNINKSTLQSKFSPHTVSQLHPTSHLPMKAMFNILKLFLS